MFRRSTIEFYYCNAGQKIVDLLWFDKNLKKLVPKGQLANRQLSVYVIGRQEILENVYFLVLTFIF